MEEPRGSSRVSPIFGNTPIPHRFPPHPHKCLDREERNHKTARIHHLSQNKRPFSCGMSRIESSPWTFSHLRGKNQKPCPTLLVQRSQLNPSQKTKTCMSFKMLFMSDHFIWSYVSYMSIKYHKYPILEPGKMEPTSGCWQDPSVAPPWHFTPLHAMAPCNQKSPPSPGPHGLSEITIQGWKWFQDGNRWKSNIFGTANQIQSAGYLSVLDSVSEGSWMIARGRHRLHPHLQNEAPDRQTSLAETQRRQNRMLRNPETKTGFAQVICKNMWKEVLLYKTDHNCNRDASSDMQGLQSGYTGTL